MNTIVVVILILLFIFVVVPLLAFMFMVKTVDNTVRDLGKSVKKSVDARKKAQETMKFPSTGKGYISYKGKIPVPAKTKHYLKATFSSSGLGSRYWGVDNCAKDEKCAAIAFTNNGYTRLLYKKSEVCKALTAETGGLEPTPLPLQEGLLVKNTLNCAAPAPIDAEDVEDAQKADTTERK